jgi:glycosyltransferase involved in cell wall biosynthesis
VSFDSIVTGLYLLTLGCLALYGLHRVWLVACFRWPRDAGAQPEQGGELPPVTVQLPLFNERTVAARLIRSVGAFDYPPGRLEIQVLDDSSDETCAIVDQEVAALRSRGLDAKVLRRAERTGFKAGALEQGSRVARGELLCIFDADFRPGPDFLRRMVPAFRDPRIGMVQARWEHENRDETLLTRAGSALLDGHFVVEHKVRFDHDLFFNFNGTAGIWRRETIEQAGGWQHDTLTEDLDLSYRAQLAGWRFHYAHAVTAPAEVPADISAFKSQQHRWARGSVQVARKLVGRILSAELPVRTKLEAWAHLTGNIGYPFVLLLAVLLPLVARAGTALPEWWHLSAFVVCTLSVMLFYERSQRAIGRSLRQRLLDVPLAMALGIGMCVSQTRAVLGGLVRGATGEFVRTPKRGDGGTAPRYRAALSGWPGIELAFAAWFSWALVSAVRDRSWGSLPFLLLFFWGFVWVGSLSLCEWLARRQLSARSAQAARTRRGAQMPA